MPRSKNKTIGIVLGIFALVIVTTAASFAFFTYSRVGETTTTITSGDIEFTYDEGASAGLANAFPISDSVGAVDTAGEYTFTVNMKSSATSSKMNYNVYLIDANETTGVNYFNNEQIKFALVKNGTFVADTSSITGKKLSEVAGFTAGSHEGEGLVLKDQEIAANVTDTYKLRIWISDDVNYSNTVNGQDEQTSVGKYNGYKYSLKVKVEAGVDVNSTTVVNTPTVNKLTMTTEVSDPNGLDAYAVTTSLTAPEEGSNEWISITDESAKSNVVRTANITTKTITFMVKKNGTHYLHVKNKLGQVKRETFVANATGEVATTKIMNLASTKDWELRIYEHEATGQQNFAVEEYRYYGKFPQNYVWFNNELWRILGVLDVDDGTGNIEKRLKIVRSEPIGYLSWDTSDFMVNRGFGVNEWNQADLMELMNTGDYYNRQNSYSTIGLTNEAKELIGNAKWYLGAHNDPVTLTGDLYNAERGTESSKQCTQNQTFCSDTVERKTSWIGQIGLMYPSDFGYSTDMIKCGDVSFQEGSGYEIACKDTTWLINWDYTQWFLTPFSYTGNAGTVFTLSNSGYIDSNNASTANSTSPVTYLKYNVKILDGDGSAERPFVLSK